MMHTYGQKNKAAKRVVDKARRDIESDVYNKLYEDGGKKIIYEMARNKDGNSKDVYDGTFIKDRNGKLLHGTTEPGRKSQRYDIIIVG